MSQSDSTSFGSSPQERSVNPLPFSAGRVRSPDGSIETLSDVAVGENSAGNWGLETPLEALTRDASTAATDHESDSNSGQVIAFGDEYFSSELGVDDGSASQPPDTCNTGGASSHEGLIPGGLDTLEVSLYGFWPPSVWNRIRPEMEAARRRAEAGKPETAYIRTDDGDQLMIAPTGTRKGVYCRYILEWQGCVIAIVDNPAPSENRLSVHVTIGSVRLMRVGHEQAWETVLSVLAAMGYEHHREVVGRADLCVDLADTSMQMVDDAIGEQRIISRARKAKQYRTGDRLETFVLGSGPMLMRIYDKAIESRNDVIKTMILVQTRWGKLCSEAMRVEFQLRNDVLRRHFSISSVEELFERLGTVSKWCTHTWVRITDRKVDRRNKNQSRAGVSEFWTTVQSKFADWTGTALPRIPRVKLGQPDFQALKEQAIGCIAAAVAHMPGVEFMDYWEDIGREWLPKAMESIKGKRLALAAQDRLVIDESEIPF